MNFEPGAGTAIVDLPWGILDKNGMLHTALHLKEITGEEEDVLADRGAMMIQRINRILANCTTQVGTVTDRASITSAIAKMTSPDRILALIRLRALSIGGDYHQQLRCTECGREQRKTINLLELPVKVPATPEKRVYTTPLPSGRTVDWAIMDGDLEEITSRVRQFDGDRADKKTNRNLDRAKISFAMWVRLISMDDYTFSRKFPRDVDGVPIVDEKEIVMVQGLCIRDRQHLRHEVETIEAGIDLEFDFRCENPDCKYLNKAEVDITQGEFFFPSVR